jgi:hypothetical protein
MISMWEEHALPHESRVDSGRTACSEAQHINVAVAVLDDRLGIYTAGLGKNRNPCWSLHVLSWQRPSQADVGGVVTGTDCKGIQGQTSSGRMRLYLSRTDYNAAQDYLLRARTPATAPGPLALPI